MALWHTNSTRRGPSLCLFSYATFPVFTKLRDDSCLSVMTRSIVMKVSSERPNNSQGFFLLKGTYNVKHNAAAGVFPIQGSKSFS